MTRIALSTLARVGTTLLVLGAAVAAFGGPTLPDQDGDGVPDEYDNCLVHSNFDQVDADLDGYGNRCDADFNNDGAVGAPDFNAFRAAFGTTVTPSDPALDFTGDGVIANPDFNIFRSLFGGVPGPSGLACAGTVPCEAI